MNKYVRNEFGDVEDNRFTFVNGFTSMYTGIERGEFVGYTVILKRPNKKTWLLLESEDEAWNTINNHVENYDRYCEQDKAESLYCSNNAWTRGN